jgi:peroxiredoxin Q/BCP
MMNEGQIAPDFSLPNEAGERVTLSQFKGRQVVLYFYPKDMTPGCTQEACDFRDNWAAVQAKGAVVLGVSADTSESHQKFKDKYELPFPLLSDEDKKVLKTYGVLQKVTKDGEEKIKIIRTTVLIDKDGKVKKVWSPVGVAGHATDVLANL